LEREICVVSFLRPLLSISRRDSQNLHAFLSACTSVPWSASKNWVVFTAIEYMTLFYENLSIFSGLGENLPNIADSSYEDICTC
jgi:hypothetical protein